MVPGALATVRLAGCVRIPVALIRLVMSAERAEDLTSGPPRASRPIVVAHRLAGRDPRRVRNERSGWQTGGNR